MTIKTEKKDEFTNLYSLPIEIGKQLFGNSNMGNFNYGLIKENWHEYSEMFSHEMNKLIEFDEIYFKNMTTLWNEFTNTINSGIVKLNGFEKENYHKMYKTLLTDLEELRKNYNGLIEKQLKDETKLFNFYEPLLLNIGFKETSIDQISELIKSISDYYNEMWNNYIEMYNKVMTDMDSTKFFDELQKFSEIWEKSNIGILKQMTEQSIFDNWKEQFQNQYQLGSKMIESIFSNYMKNFDWNRLNKPKETHVDLPSIKEKIEEISNELEKYKKHSTSKKSD